MLLMLSTATRVLNLSFCSVFALILFVVRCVRVRGSGLRSSREVGVLVHHPKGKRVKFVFFLVNGGSALVQKTQDDMREAADRSWVDVPLALALTHTMDQSKLQLH